jgi:hypothetical protein
MSSQNKHGGLAICLPWPAQGGRGLKPHRGLVLDMCHDLKVVASSVINEIIPSIHQRTSAPPASSAFHHPRRRYLPSITANFFVTLLPFGASIEANRSWLATSCPRSVIKFHSSREPPRC